MKATFRCHGVCDDFNAEVDDSPPRVVRMMCPDGKERGFSLTLAPGAWQAETPIRVDYDLLEEELP
jgi:hypothetical protein